MPGDDKSLKINKINCGQKMTITQSLKALQNGNVIDFNFNEAHIFGLYYSVLFVDIN